MNIEHDTLIRCTHGYLTPALYARITRCRDHVIGMAGYVAQFGTVTVGEMVAYVDHLVATGVITGRAVDTWKGHDADEHVEWLCDHVAPGLLVLEAPPIVEEEDVIPAATLPVEEEEEVTA